MDNILKIEKARHELNEIGLKKGLQDPEVIAQSRVLDDLINQYYRISRGTTEVKAAS